VHADDFIIDDSSTWQAIKGIAKCLPEFDTETTTALIIETVYPVDPSTLMITT